jgi:hypothetical protein
MENVRKTALIIVGMMLVSMSFVAVNTKNGEAQTEPTVSLNTMYGYTPEVGQNFTVVVQISNAANVWSYQIGMTWNSSVVRMDSIVSGGWFESQVPQGTLTLFVAGDIDNDASQGSLNGAGGVIFGNTGADGSGDLAICTFTALKQSRGEEQIDLTTVLQLPDQGHPTIQHIDIGAPITITFRTDYNRDGRVDMKDIGFIAKHFGETPASPSWDPRADTNRDGKVDMKDVGQTAKDFGKAYP